LSAELDHVSVLTIPEKGRGRALRAAWMASSADVVAYTDVDLSTGSTGCCRSSPRSSPATPTSPSDRG